MNNTPTNLNDNAFKVSNVMKWVIILSPIAILFLHDLISKNNISLFDFLSSSYILSVVCSYVDEENLKKLGYKFEQKILFIPPLYLKERAKLLNHKKSHMLDWFAVLIIGSITILTSSSKSNNEDYTDVKSAQVSSNNDKEYYLYTSPQGETKVITKYKTNFNLPAATVGPTTDNNQNQANENISEQTPEAQPQAKVEWGLSGGPEGPQAQVSVPQANESPSGAIETRKE